jgi:hypothetical protein
MENLLNMHLFNVAASFTIMKELHHSDCNSSLQVLFHVQCRSNGGVYVGTFHNCLIFSETATRWRGYHKAHHLSIENVLNETVFKHLGQFQREKNLSSIN